MKILVIGGAGFIGNQVALLLLKHGHQVKILDNLSPQVHPEPVFPIELSHHAECIKADVRDESALQQVLEGVEVVVHLAAETGTGQSMYKIGHYTEVNTGGTAKLLDLLINQPHNVRRIVLSSSRSVYGEGPYLCSECGIVYPPSRSIQQLSNHQWEMNCPQCGKLAIQPLPTHEDALLQPQSIYASTKQSQEQLISITSQARELESIILRYQNVYGPGQALTNPYTGVICAFFSLIIKGSPVTLYEDGKISRDFIFIDDVVNATVAAAELSGLGAPKSAIMNVGSGERISIKEVAEVLYQVLKTEPNIRITGQFRLGDVRHCYADITRLRQQLSYNPQFSFSNGIKKFVEWALTQEDSLTQSVEHLERAKLELAARNLFRS